MEIQSDAVDYNKEIAEKKDLNQAVYSQEKLKSGYQKAIMATALICAVAFGLGGYYFGNNQPPKDEQNLAANADIAVTESSTITINEENIASWKKYTSESRNFSFEIPQEFVVSETESGIAVFLSQQDLDKSETCKPDPNDLGGLPCSPALFDVFYAEEKVEDYPNGEDYVNYVRGGMGGTPYEILQGKGIVWTAGQAAGLELRPSVRAFAYDEDKLRYLQLDTHILPFWQFSNNLSTEDNDWAAALAKTDLEELQEFSYKIISTFEFTE